MSQRPRFKFKRPPEAPVFTPTEDEFKDPLAYIHKIRPQAEVTGICKIRPPPRWQPPFAVDVDHFKFTPRIQRLNELEAKTRINLNFLDRLAKFWELQGSALRIPIIDQKPLDLYGLHERVNNEGGRQKINMDKKWNWIAGQLGFDTSRGPVIKGHYDRFVYPFDLFTASKNNDPVVPPQTQTAPKIKGRPPTSATPMILRGRKIKTVGEEARVTLRPKYACRLCTRRDAEHRLIFCEGCNDCYHLHCLTPPLHDIPKGDWRCPQCVATEVDQPSEAFGFEDGARAYTLQQFGEMADQFKSTYFGRPPHTVSSTEIETEFWRIVSTFDEDVTVEYGADLHSSDYGSGFPMGGGPPGKWGMDEKYIESGWNLNSLPVLAGSLLRHINGDISGMTVPWLYVGMCFSSFCWHNEDHWSYSINYLHWGEVKTWYGVPGSRADDFESAMQKAARELFQSQPDLLHQLVTIINPNVLTKAGVPVFRTDQQPGEFVVTFPRAYHAGFNQGYNFAEAVNFAPADWISVGRSCIDHYSKLRRSCVFSHDELICSMANSAGDLDSMVTAATTKDFVKMLRTEKENRRRARDWGLTQTQREFFELINDDDDKVCYCCKTTCFLSAITCACAGDRLVCLRHYDQLCDICEPKDHILKFRYTVKELAEMEKKLNERLEQWEITAWQELLDSGAKNRQRRLMDIKLPRTPNGNDTVTAVTPDETRRLRSSHQRIASAQIKRKPDPPSADIENQPERKRKEKESRLCGASDCNEPEGVLNWIQCEFGCDLWFHFNCIGLKTSDVLKIQRYCCTRCKI